MDIEEYVIEQPKADPPAPADKSSDGGGKKGEKADKAAEGDDVKAIRAELDRIRKERDELAESERYWAKQAQARRGEKDPEQDDAEPEEEDEDEDEDDEPEKVVDEFSAKGIEALVKRGVLTKKAARELIQREAAKIAKKVVSVESAKLARDAELMQKFPDLADTKSDMFRKTGEIYREMVAMDPELKRSPAALMFAARQAKLELGQNGHQEREEDRLKRVAAQAGEKGRRGGGFDEEEDDVFGPQARQVLDAFSRYGVTEQGYRDAQKRLKGGR